MSFTTEERTRYADAYTRTLIRSWSDDAYARRLDSDPAGTLADAGIPLPAGTTVTVDRTPADPTAGAHGVEAQVDLLERAGTTGAVTLYLPPAPRVDTDELEASELHGVAAGGVWDPYCCSCCPSCCSASGG